ncbi:hypothetical protein [Candidatus Palauibacter sp.]|uniref:hypothetical protein n=1 Tax=Candidatus Palauibacter sp. TaxID=3101350 RepID=UPI003B51789D
MIAHLKGREKALESFGWTGREAEWIALVCLHSGVFTRDQICDWLGIHPRSARRFIRDMSDRRLAARDRLAGRRVCRIYARAAYRALGAENIRHRRIASVRVLLRRLLSLDYVMEHTGQAWLPTEAEKVAAFEALGIERVLLPVRVYRGGGGDTRRHFPLKLPVALDAGGAVFVYADPGHDTAAGLRSWGRAHRELWEGLQEQGRKVEAVAVVLGDGEFERAEKVLANWTDPKRSPGRAQASATGREIRREIEQIEQGIRGRDKRVTGRYGSLRGCLVRLAELRDALPAAPSEAMIDGFTVWRSTRLSGDPF